MYKNCKVVMLSTNKKANYPKYNILCLDLYNLETERKLTIIPKMLTSLKHKIMPQHLYITSDDEIKEGDWCYDSDIKNIFKAVKGNLRFDDYIKKVIATTDSSLRIDYTSHPTMHTTFLPQPSQSFIEEYVEEYNKGNITTDVLVGMTNSSVISYKGENGVYKIPSKLKVSKDNTITIKKVKDSWNREEVEKLLIKHQSNYRSHVRRTNDWSMNINKWIEENI